MAGSTGRGDRFQDLVAARWPHVHRPPVDQQIARARTSDRIGVILFGEPGTGKTQLARAASSSLGDAKAVIDVAGVAGRTAMTLGAFRPVLPSMDGVPLPSLLRWATARLREAAGSDQFDLVVDDAHLLDPLSAALVHQLAVTGDAFVLATARTTADLPDAIDRFWNDGAERVELGPLGTDEVAAVLAHALGDEVVQTTVQSLAEASAGNPLYLRELCLHGLEVGCLERRSGLWTWRGPFQIGGGLREMLVERIGILDPASQETLELLAFAEPLGLGLLEHLVGISVIDGLEQRQLITVSRAGLREEARLAHPLYGEVLRTGATERAPAIQALLADTFESRAGRRSSDLLQLAQWRLAAGQRIDPEWLITAAQQAAAAFDHVRAEELARAAVHAGGGPEAVLVLGSVLRELDRFEEAEQVWAADPLPPDHPLHLRIQLARAQNLFFGIGRTAEASALLAEASAHTTSVRQRDEIALEHATVHLYQGRPVDARRSVEHLLTHESADLRRSAAVFVGPSLALEGRCEQALEVIAAALIDREESSDQVTGFLLAGRFLALQLAGRLLEADSQARFARDVALALGAYDGVAIFSLAVGQISLMAGRVDEAVTELEEAAVLLREHDRNRYLPWALGEIAHAHVIRGDTDRAHAVLAEADEVHHPDFRLFECRLEQTRVRFEVATGRPDDAIRRALAAGTWAVRAGQSALGAHAFHDVVRLGMPEAAAGVLSQLASRSDSQLVSAMSAHAAACRDGDASALEQVGNRFEQMGATVLAAEAHRDASIVHAGHGRRGPAFASATLARRLAGACVGAQFEWIESLPGLSLLSAREQEVAELTAAGLPSRVVAERLYVSVRTVENHLHHVYGKLGLRGRVELAAALSPGSDPTEWHPAHDTAVVAPYRPSDPRSEEVGWTRSP